MLILLQLILSLAMGVIFIGQAWAHLRAVGDAACYIALAVLGGVNIGVVLCYAIVYFARRDDS